MEIEPHNQALSDLFASRGVQVTTEGDWIRLPKGIRALAVVRDQDTGEIEASMVQLDVVLQIWTGRNIVESCAGFGESREEAVANAFESFAASALDPFLVAFLHREGEGVVRDAWEIDGEMRAITVGPVNVRGNPPRAANADMGWFHAFGRKLRASSVASGTHWIRVYYAQQDGKPVAKEVLLDNAPWAWMQDALAETPWPQGEEFFSLRLSLVVQGGLDVSRAVARMIDLAGKPDGEIGPLLAEDGADPKGVQALLAFIPLAFGRVALQELPVKFSETAIVREQQGEDGVEIRLTDHPVFAEADRLVREAVEHDLMTQEEFLAVAMRSAEVHAVNQALSGGVEAKNVTVSAPVVTLF